MTTPPGTRIRLLHMNDPYPLPPGSTGTITGTDTLCDLLVSWDCGSTLKLIPEVDEYLITSSECTTAVTHTEQEMISFPATPQRLSVSHSRIDMNRS